MKTLRMARNIAALSIVAMALVASPPGRAAQAEGEGNGSCDLAINPCCCKNGHTQFDKKDPRYESCELTCSFGPGPRTLAISRLKTIWPGFPIEPSQ